MPKPNAQMALKPDQERVKTLLKDTITLLCRNGLSFSAKFCIDAVIGVTVDDSELFYMSMNEVIKSEKALLKEQAASSEEEGEESGVYRKRPADEQHKKKHKHKRPRIKRESEGSSDEENGHNDHDDAASFADSSQHPAGETDEGSSSILMAVKREADKGSGEDSNDIVFIKEELDDAWPPSGSNNANTSQGSYYQGMPGSSNQDQMFQADSSQQDQSFGSLSDVNLVPVGSQEGAMMWAQTGNYQGVGRGRGRGRSSTATSASQQPGSGDLSMQSGIDQQPERLQEQQQDEARTVARKTKNKAEWARGIYEAWVKSRLALHDQSTKIEPGSIDHLLSFNSDLRTLSTTDLEYILSECIAQVRKRNGDRFPPKTLQEIIWSLQKYLLLNGRSVRLSDPQAFPNLFGALDKEMKVSTQAGLGTTIKQAQNITVVMEEKLWNMGILGTTDPTKLLRTVFFTVGMNSGISNKCEPRELTGRNFEIKVDEDGHSFVEFKYLKRIREGLSTTEQMDSKRVYANTQNHHRCPVRIIDLYMKKCPADALEKAFYLKELAKYNADTWYSSSPLGIHSLSKLLGVIMKEAGIEGNFTMHSFRVAASKRESI